MDVVLDTDVHQVAGTLAGSDLENGSTRQEEFNCGTRLKRA
ncbi:MAG: hypothetical protein VX346_02160 [Planctomycetota bacterium]|nr:hypothetical protein [Planctomycetota bacterium]